MANNTEISKELYTPLEVSRLFSINIQSTRLYIREGLIKTVRIGRNYRIPASEVNRILKEGIKR